MQKGRHREKDLPNLVYPYVCQDAARWGDPTSVASEKPEARTWKKLVRISLV